MNRSAAALILFALLSASRDVYAKELFSGTPVRPETLTLFFCAVTWLLFYIFASIAARKVYTFSEVRRLTPEHKRRLLYLNAMTLVAFVTTFMAIKRLDAYTNSLVDYGASPMVATLLAVWIRRERVSASALGGMMLSALGIVILTGAMVESAKGGNDMLGYRAWGFILAGISCVGFGLNQVWNKQLVDAGLRRDHILVARLPFAVVGLGVWWFIDGSPPIGVPWWKLTVWSVLGVSVPLYLLVYAFETLDVRHIAYFLFLIPVFTFAGSMVSGHLTKSIPWVHIVAGIVVLFGVIWADRASQDAPPAATKGEIAT